MCTHNNLAEEKKITRCDQGNCCLNKERDLVPIKEAAEKVLCYGCLDNSYFLGTNLKLEVDEPGSKTGLMYKEITFVCY